MLFIYFLFFFFSQPSGGRVKMNLNDHTHFHMLCGARVCPALISVYGNGFLLVKAALTEGFSRFHCYCCMFPAIIEPTFSLIPISSLLSRPQYSMVIRTCTHYNTGAIWSVWYYVYAEVVA